MDMRTLPAFAALAVLAGCPSSPTRCDFPVRCVDDCISRNEVSYMCGDCPAGSVRISTCVDDAGPPSEDASFYPDVPDAPAADVPTVDAPVPAGDDIVAPACGPADGPALRFGSYASLNPALCAGDPAGRAVEIMFHDLGEAPYPPVAPTTVTSTEAASNGFATECPGGSPPCRTSQDWELTLDTFEEEVGATGSYVIHWEDGSTTSGNLAATWCDEGPLLCG